MSRRPTRGLGPARERGASLVEFALIAPVLFALLLGMITGGLALSAKNSMTNAVREGGRLGATLPKNLADPAWSWDVWAVDVKDRVVEVAGGDVDGNDVCVELVSLTPPSDPADPPVEGTEGRWPVSGACPLSTGAPSTPSSVEVGSCLVKVWAEREAELNVVFFSRTLDLDASAIGLYERKPCP